MVDPNPPQVFGTWYHDRVAPGAVISGYATHRALGQYQRIPDRVQGLRVDPGDGGAPLALQAQVLGDQRAVGQGQEAVVAPVDRKFPFGNYPAVPVQPVEERTVDRVDRPVGVGQDRPAPHMVSARQLPRGGHRLQAVRVYALYPAVGGRAGEGRHGASEEPFPRVALHHHHVPPIVVTSGDRRGARGGIQAAGPGLLATVAPALHGPARGPIAGAGVGPVQRGGHTGTLATPSLAERGQVVASRMRGRLRAAAAGSSTRPRPTSRSRARAAHRWSAT